MLEFAAKRAARNTLPPKGEGEEDEEEYAGAGPAPTLEQEPEWQKQLRESGVTGLAEAAVAVAPAVETGGGEDVLAVALAEAKVDARASIATAPSQQSHRGPSHGTATPTGRPASPRAPRP